MKYMYLFIITIFLHSNSFLSIYNASTAASAGGSETASTTVTDEDADKKARREARKKEEAAKKAERAAKSRAKKEITAAPPEATPTAAPTTSEPEKPATASKIIHNAQQTIRSSVGILVALAYLKYVSDKYMSGAAGAAAAGAGGGAAAGAGATTAEDDVRIIKIFQSIPIQEYYTMLRMIEILGERMHILWSQNTNKDIIKSLAIDGHFSTDDKVDEAASVTTRSAYLLKRRRNYAQHSYYSEQTLKSFLIILREINDLERRFLESFYKIVMINRENNALLSTSEDKPGIEMSLYAHTILQALSAEIDFYSKFSDGPDKVIAQYLKTIRNRVLELFKPYDSAKATSSGKQIRMYSDHTPELFLHNDTIPTRDVKEYSISDKYADACVAIAHLESYKKKLVVDKARLKTPSPSGPVLEYRDDALSIGHASTPSPVSFHTASTPPPARAGAGASPVHSPATTESGSERSTPVSFITDDLESVIEAWSIVDRSTIEKMFEILGEILSTPSGRTLLDRFDAINESKIGSEIIRIRNVLAHSNSDIRIYEEMLVKTDWERLLRELKVLMDSESEIPDSISKKTKALKKRKDEIGISVFKKMSASAAGEAAWVDEADEE